ncbi:matrix protein [Mediterranean bat virus]|uniref:Matrix protein n=1 Tax=Mediterranean bat virus TaxID=2892035 RepID=A0AAE9C4Y8_9RHAB|nr:matrix protein [Mediterranean bat virus]UED36864.1 matrix protein [Mediterranean bat virus]UED36869.1 matrix protein [Mediterranean bat virus]UED36874.1 matrix protein [Mediterranean bat virus]UED36879.1 matrix protein [Mediterranean bat virus]UED36884.1 matrix protein [Mediterranean bat virus]
MLALRNLRRKKGQTQGEDSRPLPFWEMATPDLTDSAPEFDGYLWSIRFRCSLRITTNRPFQSLPETLVVTSLWEQEYSGYSAKRPFYRAILLILVRKLRQVGQVSYRGQTFEYQSELSGRGNLWHNIPDLPAMRAGEDIFSKSWDYNGRYGSILYKVDIGDLDPDPGYHTIIDQSYFSSEEEFEDSAKLLGVRLTKSAGRYLLEL